MIHILLSYCSIFWKLVKVQRLNALVVFLDLMFLPLLDLSGTSESNLFHLHSVLLYLYLWHYRQFFFVLVGGMEVYESEVSHFGLGWITGFWEMFSWVSIILCSITEIHVWASQRLPKWGLASLLYVNHLVSCILIDNSGETSPCRCVAYAMWRCLYTLATCIYCTVVSIGE